MQIVVAVVGQPVNEQIKKDPKWREPGHRLVFGDNLALLEVAGKTPGNGLPGDPADPPRAGTQSGFLTTVANDKDGLLRPIPQDGVLFQHESTYTLTAVPGNPGLQEGQITTQGVFAYPDGSKTLAITGGTGAYANARGQITEDGKRHTLEIVF